MKTVLLFGVLLLWSVSKGEVYKTKQPFIYQGQVYAALMNFNGNDTLQNGVQVISINFYILRPDKGNLKNFEGFGGYFNVTRTFTLTNGNEYKLIPGLSTTGNDGLCRFTRCTPHFSKDKVDVLLTEYREFNNFKVQLFKVETGIAVMDQNDFISNTYQD